MSLLPSLAPYPTGGRRPAHALLVNSFLEEVRELMDCHKTHISDKALGYRLRNRPIQPTAQGSDAGLAPPVRFMAVRSLDGDGDAES